MASERVFGIPVLFEAILLQLPSKDLLMAQNVCKTWLHYIENSTPILRALFLKPETRTGVGAVDTPREPDETWTDINNGYVRALRPEKLLKSSKRRAPVRLNPFLFDLVPNTIPSCPGQITYWNRELNYMNEQDLSHGNTGSTNNTRLPFHERKDHEI